MTPIILLDDLQKFIEKNTADILLEVKVRTGNVKLVQRYTKETPVILFSLSILISFIMDRQSVRFSSRVSVT